MDNKESAVFVLPWTESDSFSGRGENGYSLHASEAEARRYTQTNRTEGDASRYSKPGAISDGFWAYVEKAVYTRVIDSKAGGVRVSGKLELVRKLENVQWR